MSTTKVAGGRQKNQIQLTGIDADWDSGGYRPLQSIQFNPGSSATDVFIVKAETDAGPALMTVKGVLATDHFIKYFNGVHCHVYIDYSACTFSTGHVVTIVFEEE